MFNVQWYKAYACGFAVVERFESSVLSLSIEWDKCQDNKEIIYIDSLVLCDIYMREKKF